MGEKEIRAVVESTEKEFEKKKVEQRKEAIKEIVQRTLERIDELDNRIKGLEEEKRILKLDIEDMKNGKLDLIEERQRKSEKARNTSLVIIKEVHKEYIPTPWYQPYYIQPNPIVWPEPVIWCNGTTLGATYSNAGTITNSASSCNLSDGLTFTCSAVRDNTVGTYEISGHIVNLR